MTKRNSALFVRSLEKVYRGVKALAGIDLQVAKGSVFALLGPNGAGKTTAIRILSTLTRPDGGTATVCGFDVVRQAADVRDVISLTGQNTAVDEILSGRENLRLIARLRHMDDVASKVDGLLERFGLRDAADRRVGTYSGGMRRRLDLAMSLLGEPTIIFLDEPTTGLDPQGRTAIWDVVRELARAGTTVFLTTQYLEEADQLADRIAILDKGKIIAEGSPAELKKLLPSGHVELRFFDQARMAEAQAVLDRYTPTSDPENLALTCDTDGTVDQVADILNRLAAAGVGAAGFTQKLPTLDDVFLALVGSKGEQQEETK